MKLVMKHMVKKPPSDIPMQIFLCMSMCTQVHAGILSQTE